MMATIITIAKRIAAYLVKNPMMSAMPPASSTTPTITERMRGMGNPRPSSMLEKPLMPGPAKRPKILVSPW